MGQVSSQWAPRRWLLVVRWLNLLFFCACLLTEGNVGSFPDLRHVTSFVFSNASPVYYFVC